MKIFILFVINLLFINALLSNAMAQIVFLDINDNPKEKATAIAAAKRAGKEIIIYPKGSEKFQTERAFEILSENPPETLFISGHDGGGSFGGDRGESFEYEDLHSLIETNPEIGENLRVLGLLGCNTANHVEITKWKRTFPNLAFVAGYDGSAPSETKKAALTYISDTISKSEEILQATDERKIRSIFESFQYINYLEATLYVDTCPQSDSVEGQYIFRPARTSSERFKAFDTAECAQKRTEYDAKYLSIYTNYYYGLKEIPTQTHGTDLRRLYTFMRQNEHCFKIYEEGEYPTGDDLLYLLFFNNVKKNFINYYQENLDDYFKELSIFQDQETLKDSLAKKIEANSAELERLEYYKTDFVQYKKDHQRHIKDELLKMKRDYPESYRDFQRCTKDTLSRSELAHCIQLDKDPEYEFISSKIWSLQAQRDLKDDELRDNLEMKIDSTTESLRKVKDLYINPVKMNSLIKKYQALSAKSPQDLSKLSRKEIMDFSHKTFEFDRDFLPSSQFFSNMRGALDDTLVSISSTEIPFNWHDSGITPTDPIYTNRLSMRAAKEQSVASRLFEN